MDYSMAIEGMQFLEQQAGTYLNRAPPA